MEKLESCRVPLAFLPTPLEKVNRLSNELGTPVFIKRDDCTGLAGGGNKTRKLEFLLYDAQEKAKKEGKKLVVITAGGVQSNHCRQTIAACAKEDIECHLVLTKNVSGVDDIYFNTGNMQLDQILGAHIHLRDKVDRQAEMEKLADTMKDNCYPYVIPLGGSSPVGCLGYIFGAKEMFQQMKDNDNIPEIETIYLATSSYGTHAGLIIGTRLFAKDIIGYIPTIIGVDVDGSPDAIEVEERIYSLCKDACSQFSLSDDFIPRSDVKVLCSYGGDGYGIPTETSKNKVISLARSDGILLDPVYTGKAFDGMVSSLQKSSQKGVIFLHTGGLPGIFAYPIFSDTSLVEDSSTK